MSDLEIVELSDDLPLIKRVKKSLKKKFNSNSENDINNAVRLSNYLFTLGKNEEAEKLLKSFVRLTYEEKEGHLWTANAQAIILLAWISRENNDFKYERELVDIMKNHDVLSTHYTSRYEAYLEDYEDHEANMEYAMSETKKYKCEVIGQEALTFLYFYEMLPLYKNEVPSSLENDLMSLIGKCYSELKSALN